MYAQVGTATLSGVIADASGASVPNAEVSLESLLRQFSRKAVSNISGEYVIPAIPPGTYKLIVTAQGFGYETRTDIPLSSGQSSTLNVALTVSGATQQVTVLEAPPLLQTTTATVGTVVQTSQINELPLLGRNFTTLTTIAPGVAPVNAPDGGSPSSVGGTGVNPSVYGQRQRDNDYTLDGVGNNEPLFSGIPMLPPPEAIAEMKIESGMSSGAYGHAAGASINLVTKAGTRQFHGDAWESLRNSKLDARNFFTPRVSPYRWNQFGGAIGGPMVIPHLLSKEKGWYFFGYYEGIRIRRTSDIIALVPTPAELSGNFAGDPQIFDPYTTITGSDGKPTRQPFPNNQIPGNLLNPAALTIAKALYPTPNLPPNVIAGRNYLSSAPSLSDGDQWSGRVDHQFGAKDSFFVRYSDARNPSRSVGLPALPSVGYQRNSNVAVSNTYTFNPGFLVTGRFGMTRLNGGTFTGGDHTIARKAGTLGAFPDWHGTEVIPPILIPNYPQLGQGGGYYGPQYSLSWIGDAHKITGRHTIEFGGSIINTRFKTDNQTGTQVSFTRTQTSDFSPNTGFGLASFVLGLPESAGRVFGSTEGDMHGNVYSIYAQDNFRATPKLTFNVGLRYDYASPLINNHGSGTYLWELGKYVWDITNPITGEPANIRRGGIDPDRRNYQPRVGIAYQINDKTVARISYGIFFDVFGVNYAQTQQGNRGNWPFAFPQSVNNLNATTPNAFLENPFPGPAAGSKTPLGCQQCLNMWHATTRTPYVQEWSVSLQRTLSSTLMAEAVYFGSHGLRLGGQIVDNTAAVPGPGPIAARQVHPDFPLYVANGMNIFPSFYDALSLKLEKRLSKGLIVAANYTWSKNLDYVDSLVNQGYPFASPTRFNIHRLKGPAGFDIPQRFVLSYVYEVPVKTSSKLANALVGNWSIAGIVQIDKGLPITPLLSSDNENIGSIPGRITSFPNLVGDPNAIATRTPASWFNTAAFAVPSAFTAGNAGRNIIRADGLKNWDFSVFKQIPFKESRRFEVRAEFFNLVNNTTFGIPTYLVDTPQFGRVFSARKSGRQIQLGGKVHF
jgi:hypothetical protein